MEYINRKAFNDNRKEKNFNSIYIVLDRKTGKVIGEVKIYDAGKPNTKTTNITIDFNLPNLKVISGGKCTGIGFYRPTVAFTDALFDVGVDSDFYSAMWSIEKNIKSLLEKSDYTEDDYILLDICG